MNNLINETVGYGERQLELIEVRLLDVSGQDTLIVSAGDPLLLNITARALRETRRPNLGFALYSESDLIFSLSVLNLGMQLQDVAVGDTCKVQFEFYSYLSPGSYSLTVIAADNYQSQSEDSGVHHDTRERLGPIIIKPSVFSESFDGVGCIPIHVDIG